MEQVNDNAAFRGEAGVQWTVEYGGSRGFTRGLHGFVKRWIPRGRLRTRKPRDDGGTDDQGRARAGSTVTVTAQGSST